MCIVARLDKTIDELVELVKLNRARRQAEREQREREAETQLKGYIHSVGENQQDGMENPAVRIILFANESPFTQSVMAMIKRYTVACRLSDPEEALTLCADYEINNVILDMDSPSDHDSAADVFAALKILRPSANVFVCSKSTNSIESRALVTRGGIRLTKPLLFKDLEHLVDRYVKK